MNDLLIRGHLGLGDHLICNAIVRHYAPRCGTVFVLCKSRNVDSLEFMWRDLENVKLLSVLNDRQANRLTNEMRLQGFQILGLGAFGARPFDVNKWDREMYRQAQLDYQQRWESFLVRRQRDRELAGPCLPYIFIHDDPARGFPVPSNRLPDGFIIYRPEPRITSVIFDYWGILENACEIHCIDSCFAIFADSMPHCKATRLVWHHYARRGKPPGYRKNWIELT